MQMQDALFYGFGLVGLISAILVVVMSNPIYSALFLAVTMCVLGGLFFILEAYFVAMAQVTVYAGAVMVLFVMVVMLFDLQKERDRIFKVSPLGIVKLLAVGLLAGFFIGASWLAVSGISGNAGLTMAPLTQASDLAKSGPLPAPHNANTNTTDSDSDSAKTATDDGANEDHSDEKVLTADEAAAIAKQDIQTATATVSSVTQQASIGSAAAMGTTVELSRLLFSHYVFAFEAVSLLLLAAIVGAVALARSKGGTHD